MGAHFQNPSSKARSTFPDLAPQEELWLDRPLDSTTKQRSKPRLIDSAGSVWPVGVTTLSFENMHLHGTLFQDLLRARYKVFIEQKGWDLPRVNEMEFDQYDTPLARWIVLHVDCKILAGIRIIPTTSSCGLHSYMLRDAQLGLLNGLPTNMLYERAPTSDLVWEASRLFVCEDVSAEQRQGVQTILMKSLAAAATSLGATHVIGIVPAIFRRWLQRIGMTATPVGPKMEIEGDKVQAALMSMITLDS